MLQISHTYGGNGSFGTFIAETSPCAVECLLLVIDGEDTEDYRSLSVSIEYCRTLCSYLTDIIEVGSVTADDASDDYDCFQIRHGAQCEAGGINQFDGAGDILTENIVIGDTGFMQYVERTAS